VYLRENTPNIDINFTIDGLNAFDFALQNGKIAFAHFLVQHHNAQERHYREATNTSPYQRQVKDFYMVHHQIL
jgi:tRNA G18 (ribose-2'-O)-methylase SpoU